MYILSGVIFVVLIFGIECSEDGFERHRNYYDRFTGEKLDEGKYREFKSHGLLQ